MSSQIQRDRSRQIGFTVYAIGLCVGGYFLATKVGGFMGWMFAVLLWISAASIFGFGLFRGDQMGSADCPHCGQPISGLDMAGKDDRLCGSCNQFVRAHDGALIATPQDAIAAGPIFGANVPDRFSWPEGCCICGAPATRQLEVSAFRANLAESAASTVAATVLGSVVGVGVLVRRGTTTTLGVPHCDDHEHGARLAHGTDGLILYFRSFPYYRAFQALNDLRPADVKAISPTQEALAAGTGKGSR